MSHLIAGTTAEFDLKKMLDELRDAHAYLAENGARAFMHAAKLSTADDDPGCCLYRYGGQQVDRVGEGETCFSGGAWGWLTRWHICFGGATLPRIPRQLRA